MLRRARCPRRLRQRRELEAPLRTQARLEAFENRERMRDLKGDRAKVAQVAPSLISISTFVRLGTRIAHITTPRYGMRFTQQR